MKHAPHCVFIALPRQCTTCAARYSVQHHHELCTIVSIFKAQDSYLPKVSIPSYTTDIPSLKSFDDDHYKLRSYMINTLELDQMPYEDYCEFCIRTTDSIYLPHGFFGSGPLPQFAVKVGVTCARGHIK